MANSFPSKVTQLASVHQLGAPLEKRISSSETVLLFSILATLSAIAGLYAFAASAPWIALIGSILFVGFLYGAIARNKLYIFERGLIHITSLQKHVIPYNQIEAVWKQVVDIVDRNLRTRTKVYFYTIRYGTGKTLRLRLPDVGDRILEEVCYRKMPQIQAAYQAGEEVWFGAIAIAQQGLIKRKWFNRWGQKLVLPWSAIDSIKLEGGMLTIWSHQRRTFRWIQIPTHQIPNFPLCVALLENRIEIQRGGLFANLSIWNQLWQLFGGGLKW